MNMLFAIIRHIPPLLLFFVSAAVISKPMEPPMILVPAGEVTLGPTEFEDTTPMTLVSLDAFGVGKFEVTRLEFAQFIKDTGFSAPSACYHEIGYWWFEQDSAGSWNDNGINTSLYEPLSCIGYDAAVAYTNWLSQKTSKPYRLLSEAEWEYLGVNFADNSAPVCEHANIADQRAESFAQTKYGSSYINLIGIEDCDDHAGTVSMVVQYQPNVLGDEYGFIFSANAGEQTLTLTTGDAGWQLDELVFTEVQ